MRKKFDPAIATILQLNPQGIVDKIRGGPVAAGAEILQALIEEEQELSRLNILKPYEDKVPLVLQRLDVPAMAAVFNQLDEYYILKALFGNFRTVEESIIEEVLEALNRGKAADLLERMSIGVDNPKKAARILKRLSPTPMAEILARVHPACVVQFLDESEPEERTYILGGVRPRDAAAVLCELLAGDNRVRLARAASLLRRVGPEARQAILDALPEAEREALTGELARRMEGELTRMTVKEAKGAVNRVEAAQAAALLREVDGERQVEILKACGAERAAQILGHMAGEDPGMVADLLEEMNTSLILHLRQEGGKKIPVRELYIDRAAGVLERLDPRVETTAEALRLMERAALEGSLARLSEEKREEILSHLKDLRFSAELPLSFQLFSVGMGKQRTVRLDPNLKWTRIEEQLDTGEKVKPVIIDLVEMDPTRVRIQACAAITDANALPIEEVARIFGDAKREGRRPDKQIFTRLGLIQLGKVVKASGAIAGINGNHYYDYGHYMDALKLGIDPTKVPGLFFGDPVGWFVMDGVEVSPPSFNRAAFAVTKDGKACIQKVFMTDVQFAGGPKIRWDALNAKKEPGKIILYNSLFGFRTEKDESHVDVAVAKGRVFAMSEEGDAPIPLTGYLLSVPRERAEELLRGVRVGTPCVAGNNFPTSLGEVHQAMACGPHLVCDGQPDISFREEEFGEKDSTVMSFSLTRAVETFEAARSFMMIRDGMLTIGTVSGTALGTGAPTTSGGMTFGELAQLCLDLRADDAYALDGGGSSSIVVRVGEEVRVLNIPTGGSDVEKGEERFINTYWLLFRR